MRVLLLVISTFHLIGCGLLFRPAPSRTGEVVTREHMYRDILKTTYDGHDRGLDIHISRLRPKLSPYGVSIHAVRGSGYILSA